jgi:hypothetical protein
VRTVHHNIGVELLCIEANVIRVSGSQYGANVLLVPDGVSMLERAILSGEVR